MAARPSHGQVPWRIVGVSRAFWPWHDQPEKGVETGSFPRVKQSTYRPQFKALFDAAYRKEFDVVLFWSLDRFSREGVLETLQHLQKLTSWNVSFKP